MLRAPSVQIATEGSPTLTQGGACVPSSHRRAEVLGCGSGSRHTAYRRPLLAGVYSRYSNCAESGSRDQEGKALIFFSTTIRYLSTQLSDIDFRLPWALFDEIPRQRYLLIAARDETFQ